MTIAMAAGFVTLPSVSAFGKHALSMHMSVTLDHVGDDRAYLADIAVAEFMNSEICSVGDEVSDLMQ